MTPDPSTGKTSDLTARIRRAVEAGKHLLVASFTKAAAAELTGRDLPIERNRIGTLHSHALRMLPKEKRPVFDVDRALRSDWNARYPFWAVSGGSWGKVAEPAPGDVAAPDPPTADDGPPGSDDDQADALEAARERMAVDPLGGIRSNDLFPGDALEAECGLLRGQLVPPDTWPARCREFDHAYREFLADRNGIDFIGMIEEALAPAVRPSIEYDIAVLDEAQDVSPLEHALFDKLASFADFSVAAGDPAQAIYNFRGASGQDFHAAEAKRIVLAQSYRLPQAIQLHAERWLERTEPTAERIYAPRSDIGSIGISPSSIDTADQLAGELAAVLKVHPADSVMLTASCSKFLEPVIGALRRAGIAFHNPYRLSHGGWNPLGRVHDRYTGFLAPFTKHRLWTWRELWRWVEMCTAHELLRHGTYRMIQKAQKESPNKQPDSYDFFFLPKVLDAVTAIFTSGTPLDAINWLDEQAKQSWHDRIQYPIAILRAGGVEALRPRLVIGTIHSVKGGEADHVFIAPEVSRAADKAAADATGGEGAITRTFYVGMTRAKASLTFLSQARWRGRAISQA